MNTNDFHKERIAFIIINNKVKFLENSDMSHIEWAKQLGINTDDFLQLIRGYYLNNKVIFYKGKFEYDEKCIEAAKKYSPKIKEYCKCAKLKVWCGVKVGNIGEIWDPIYFVGEF